MTSPVTKAMVESYALMVMVMGTFFLYFCGMVWAFCNPKLSGADDERGTGKQTADHEDHCWLCAPNPPEQNFRCAFARPHTAEELAHSTYIKFWDDTDSLLSNCTAFCREDRGVVNRIGESSSRTA